MMSTGGSGGAEVRQQYVRQISEENHGFPPRRYIQPEHNRPAKHPPPTCPAPIIDLGLLLLQPDREVAKLHSALHQWGLFHVVGHGIPAALLDQLLDATWEFFRNEQMEHPPETGGEGYGVDRIVDEEQILDWSERLYLLVQPEDERKMELWPATPASFGDILLEYSERCMSVVERILMAMAKSLGLGESSYFLDRFGDRGMVYKRFNHYPRCSRPDLVMGIKPHQDASALTLVLQDPQMDGLHVLNEGEWLRVPIVPGALLVNVGDQMEIMSNGIYKSPVHRVVTNAEKERVSVVSFYSMGREMEIGPANALMDEARPRMYRNILIKEYLELFYRRFPLGERTIDSVKV